jgi:putative transposase
MLERTHDSRSFRILNVIDEYTRENLAIRVARKLTHEDVQECLAELFCLRGVPAHIRSDNGPEFIADRLRQWLNRLEVCPMFMEPGSPWENGYVEPFNGKLRDELFDREIFYTLEEARTLIAHWREESITSDHTVPWAIPPCATGLVACPTTGRQCTRTNITTGTYYGGRSRAL